MQSNVNILQFWQAQASLIISSTKHLNYPLLATEIATSLQQQNFGRFSQQPESSSLSPASKKIQKNIPTAKAQKQKKTPWKPDEDAQLLKLIDKVGQRWTEIGKIIGGRTGKQVRERYLYTLKPDINKDKWTKEEDGLLMSLYQEFGNKWRQIAERLPGRTENQIKNRLNPKFRGSFSLCCSNNDSSPLETCDVSSNCDDGLSLSINLECGATFEKSCESILEMNLALN